MGSVDGDTSQKRRQAQGATVRSKMLRPQVKDRSFFSSLVVFGLWTFSAFLLGWVVWDLGIRSRNQISSVKPVALSRTSASANSEKAETKVNRYLQDLNLKLETQKVLSQDDWEKARLTLQREINQDRGRARVDAYMHPSWQPSEVDRQEILSERDLRTADQFVDESPHQQIETSLSRDEEANRIRSQQDQQYIDQFLANARKQGYEIEMDDQYQVKSIRRIGGPKGDVGARNISGSQ